MIFTSVSVLKNKALTKDLFVLDLEFPQHVQAGQFVMIRLNNNSKILPRPISIFDYDANLQKISLLIRKRGVGSEELSQLKVGDTIKIFGALGTGFDTSIKDKNIFLMGGGEGIAPMLYTSNILKQYNNVTILAGFRSHLESAILSYFNQELSISYSAIDHPKIENQGLITDLLHQYKAPDLIYTCGPIAMMQAIHNFVKNNNWNTKVYISMENRMACGVGACMGCTIPDKKDKPLVICKKGPVFPATEVFHD